MIPPTLQDFACTFAGDLDSVLGIHVDVEESDSAGSDSIFLTLGDKKDYTDAADRFTSEGYTLITNNSGIYIVGASPLGVWWGTRTVFQQAVLHHDSPAIPYGMGKDSPGWGERGMMLDAGRHYYPKEFLVEMCSYMSFFKQNIFHVHLSDNLYNNKIYSPEQSLKLDAWFRLWSDNDEVKGLNTRRNESYTRADFEEVQKKCAARGVTILPEIEAPGHALPIVQWKPDLGLSTDLSLLNISHAETIPTMKLIWREFLPWFHSKTVSIGADEYTGPANDYNRFVNAMDDFIQETSGKRIRIWGTFPPRYNYSYVNIHQDVSIQHWEYFEDNPYHDYILNNYSVLNSNDDFYIVNKWGGYPNTIDITKTFRGNPAVSGGGHWYPYIFDQKRTANNPKRSEPPVLGAIAPLWNDYGPNTSVYSEAYYAWREGLPALADKQWGGNLTQDMFDKVFAKLHPYIPGQNLQRAIPSKGDVIFDYQFGQDASSGVVKDKSPNGYDAKTNCQAKGSSLIITPDCSLTTPWSSKGRGYTLTLSLKVDNLADRTNTTLIFGSDSVLMLTPNITLLASGNYYRLNSTLPMKQWVDLSIRGYESQTFASMKIWGKRETAQEEQFLTKMGINGERFHWDVMAIEAPIKELGGWSGELGGLRLTRQA